MDWVTDKKQTAWNKKMWTKRLTGDYDFLNFALNGDLGTSTYIFVMKMNEKNNSIATL